MDKEASNRLPRQQWLQEAEEEVKTLDTVLLWCAIIGSVVYAWIGDIQRANLLLTFAIYIKVCED